VTGPQGKAWQEYDAAFWEYQYAKIDRAVKAADPARA
jgi:hypothetical protein